MGAAESISAQVTSSHPHILHEAPHRPTDAFISFITANARAAGLQHNAGLEALPSAAAVDPSPI